MLNLVLIQKNRDYFRSLFFQAYKFGFEDNSHSFQNLLKKEENPALNLVMNSIFECGEHDKKAKEQEKVLKLLRKDYSPRRNATVKLSYLFVGKDTAVNQGMEELILLAKNREKVL